MTRWFLKKPRACQEGNKSDRCKDNVLHETEIRLSSTLNP